MKVEREIGRMLGKNSRAAKPFDVKVTNTDKNAARIEWSKVEVARDWATLSAGCVLLRTNVADWSDEELWKAYIHLTVAESAFRIQKSDLSIRPIWHTKQERVLAHIFVCFLAYVLWKTLAQLCDKAGLGSEPRRVLSELSDIRSMDVVLPTRGGVGVRTRCASKPTDPQQILLEKLRSNYHRKYPVFFLIQMLIPQIAPPEPSERNCAAAMPATRGHPARSDHVHRSVDNHVPESGMSVVCDRNPAGAVTSHSDRVHALGFR